MFPPPSILLHNAPFWHNKLLLFGTQSFATAVNFMVAFAIGQSFLATLCAMRWGTFLFYGMPLLLMSSMHVRHQHFARKSSASSDMLARHTQHFDALSGARDSCTPKRQAFKRLVLTRFTWSM